MKKHLILAVFASAALSLTACTTAPNNRSVSQMDYSTLQGKFDSRDGELANKDADLAALRKENRELKARLAGLGDASTWSEMKQTLLSLGDVVTK